MTSGGPCPGAHGDGRTSRALGCAEVEAALPAIAEGTLDADGDPAVFEHLARCASCQDGLAAQDLISLALGAPTARPAPERTLRLVHVRVPLPFALAAAAGLALAAGLAWQAAAGRPTPRAAVASAPQAPPSPAATPAAGMPETLVSTVPDLVRRPDREVIRIDRPGGRPFYLIVEGDRMALVEPPEESALVPARSSAVTVGLTRY